MKISIKTLHVILNPISGADFPILPHLVRMLNSQKLSWEIFITKNHEDASLYATNAIKAKVDAVAVYGGDGTVMEVAGVLAKTQTPMIIIPGGTANILAKELEIPVDPIEALKIFERKPAKVKTIDMGVCNGAPFVIRINVGVLADITQLTSRDRKNTFGNASYIISMFESVQ